MLGQPYGGAYNTVRQSNPFANGSPFNETSPFQRGLYFVKGQRRRLNIVAILIALFVPWLLFVFVFCMMSSSVHYKQPYVAYILVLLALCFCLVACFLAMKALANKQCDSTYQPSWFVFIAVTGVVAFVLAFVTGEKNYYQYMEPYYNYQNLASYQDVDTTEKLGQQLMDAGQIEFRKGTGLDLSRSMGFKNHDIYCVAPIVTKGSANAAGSVDFWAVGKNCCSGVSADFHCSGFSDPHATGVIRMMSDEDRTFYRLAVQQAEATYHMTASHPLFFEWVHSADEAVNHFASKGRMTCFLWICVHFTLQAFLTMATTLAFSKLVHS